MKGPSEKNVICIDAGIPPVAVPDTPDNNQSIEHFWRKDFDDIKHLRHQLYIKVNQLSQYRHKSEAVQEAVYTMREAMVAVNEAQIDIDRVNR